MGWVGVVEGGLPFILLSCRNTIIKMTDSFKQHLKPIGVKTNERRLKTNSGVSLGMHRCLGAQP